MSDFLEQHGHFEVIVDRYNGLTIKNESIPNEVEIFEKELITLIDTIKDSRNLLWLDLNLSQAHLIPIATQLGFTFHTCESHKLLLVKEIKKNPIVPTAANHTLGVGVVVINDNEEILVVKERHSTAGFKLPGGHIDDGELIQSAVQREVKEETGIDVEFSSIISLGHFYPHQFNQSNLYILCYAKPNSSTISIEDTEEIIDCKWVNVYNYIEDDNVIEYNKVIVNAALNSKGFESTSLESFKNIPRNYELFFPKS